MQQIDARGRSCPEPVVMTRNGVKQNPEGIEVLVDNICAVENITRFAGSQGYQVQREEADGEWKLLLQKA